MVEPIGAEADRARDGLVHPLPDQIVEFDPQPRRPLISNGTIGQLPFLDREDGSGVYLHVTHDADAADLIGEPDVVASGFNAGDPQALPRVYFSCD